jgi:hypothetical protein
VSSHGAHRKLTLISAERNETGFGIVSVREFFQTLPLSHSNLLSSYWRTFSRANFFRVAYRASSERIVLAMKRSAIVVLLLAPLPRVKGLP